MKMEKYGKKLLHVLATFGLVYLLAGKLGIHLTVFITFILQITDIVMSYLRNPHYSPLGDTIANLVGYGFFAVYVTLR